MQSCVLSKYCKHQMSFCAAQPHAHKTQGRPVSELRSPLTSGSPDLVQKLKQLSQPIAIFDSFFRGSAYQMFV
jgi:hypothetical protein